MKKWEYRISSLVEKIHIKFTSRKTIIIKIEEDHDNLYPYFWVQ